MQDMGAQEEQTNGDDAAVQSAVTKVCPGKTYREWWGMPDGQTAFSTCGVPMGALCIHD